MSALPTFLFFKLSIH